jgi:hypothetical protein
LGLERGLKKGKRGEGACFGRRANVDDFTVSPHAQAAWPACWVGTSGPKEGAAPPRAGVLGAQGAPNCSSGDGGRVGTPRSVPQTVRASLRLSLCK